MFVKRVAEVWKRRLSLAVAAVVAFVVCTPAMAFAGEMPVYRLYNKWSGEHLYTTDVYEYQYLPTIGWRGEGEAWVSSTEGHEVFRLYNPYTGDHHYTRDLEEYSYLQGLGWRGEGPIFYYQDSDSVPIYRLFNRWLTCGTHLFTTSYGEYNTLQTLGWSAEGVAFYAVRAGSGEGKIPETDPQPVTPTNPSGPETDPQPVTPTNPSDPETVNPNTYIVYVTRYGKRYHRSSCAATSGKSTIAMTLAQAKSKGYAACKDCKPPVG